jgi:hypothetical protein
VRGEDEWETFRQSYSSKSVMLPPCCQLYSVSTPLTSPCSLHPGRVSEPQKVAKGVAYASLPHLRGWCLYRSSLGHSSIRYLWPPASASWCHRQRWDHVPYSHISLGLVRILGLRAGEPDQDLVATTLQACPMSLPSTITGTERPQGDSTYAHSPDPSCRLLMIPPEDTLSSHVC